METRTMNGEPDWQPIASRDIDKEQEPHLRISSAGKCVRAQAYTETGTPESNPPGQHATNRMALGHMAEILIIKEMERNGWETRNTVLSGEGQLELELEIPGTGRTIRGHPDGICRHPGFTNGLWVTLECKSMGAEKALEVERDGVAAVYPAYMAQIGLYSLRLHQMELVSHPGRGVFGMMDRDGRSLPPERVAWKKEDTDGTLERLAEVVKAAQAGELPEHPHPQSSSECRYCNYHTTCWGENPKPEANAEKPLVFNERPEVIQAARTWADLKPKVELARDMLQAASNSAGGADVMAEGVIGDTSSRAANGSTTPTRWSARCRRTS